MKPRLLRLVRAALLRCPLCGAGWRRRGAVDLAPRCAVCDVRIDRGETDYFLGSYTIALFGALLLAVVLTLAAVTVGRGLPTVAQLAIAVLVITAFTLWFYPFSKLLWLAVDVQFRPPEELDFSDGEAAESDRERHPRPRG